MGSAGGMVVEDRDAFLLAEMARPHTDVRKRVAIHLLQLSLPLCSLCGN